MSNTLYCKSLSFKYTTMSQVTTVLYRTIRKHKEYFRIFKRNLKLENYDLKI